MSEKIRFYTDENVPMAVAKGLRRQDVDVLTTQETNMCGASDVEHLAFAVKQGRIIITQDVDFLRLHAAGVKHAGIAYAKQHTSIGDIIRGLLLLYQVLDAQSMVGKIEFL